MTTNDTVAKLLTLSQIEAIEAQMRDDRVYDNPVLSTRPAKYFNPPPFIGMVTHTHEPKESR